MNTAFVRDGQVIFHCGECGEHHEFDVDLLLETLEYMSFQEPIVEPEVITAPKKSKAKAKAKKTAPKRKKRRILSVDEINYVQDRLANGISVAQLVKSLKVSDSVIYNIKNGKTHVASANGTEPVDLLAASSA